MIFITWYRVGAACAEPSELSSGPVGGQRRLLPVEFGTGRDSHCHGWVCAVLLVPHAPCAPPVAVVISDSGDPSSENWVSARGAGGPEFDRARSGRLSSQFSIPTR